MYTKDEALDLAEQMQSLFWGGELAPEERERIKRKVVAALKLNNLTIPKWLGGDADMIEPQEGRVSIAETVRVLKG